MKTIDLTVDGHDIQAVISFEHSVVVLVAHDVQGIGAIVHNNVTMPEGDIEDALTKLIYSTYGNVKWGHRHVI